MAFTGWHNASSKLYGIDILSLLRPWLFPAVAVACCLVCVQCFFYADKYDAPQRAKVPPIGYVTDNIIGTWHWLKPESSPVTFELFITFEPDGTFIASTSPDDTAAVVTTYEILEYTAPRSDDQMYVIEAKGYARWELVSLTMTTLKLCIPAYDDGTTYYTYERVPEE